MNIDSDFDIVYQHIITLHQLQNVISQLHSVKESLFKSAGTSPFQLEDTLPVFILEWIQFQAQKHQTDLKDAKMTQELIESCLKALESTPLAEIKLSVTPNYRTVLKIATWWRDWTKLPVVVSVVIDEQIVAGTQVSYNGTFADYSFGRWFTQKGIEFVEKSVQ